MPPIRILRERRRGKIAYDAIVVVGVIGWREVSGYGGLHRLVSWSLIARVVATGKPTKALDRRLDGLRLDERDPPPYDNGHGHKGFLQPHLHARAKHGRSALALACDRYG